MNPTSDVLEKRITALEGEQPPLPQRRSCGGGLRHKKHCQSGDHIVSSETIYGGTYNYFANTLTESGLKPPSLTEVIRKISKKP